MFLAVGDDGVAATQLADGTWDGRDSDDLVWTMHAVRDARSTWRRLFAWVVGYNTVGISIAAAGWLHPVIAAVLMTASSLGSVLWAVLHEERRARLRARGTQPAPFTPRFDTTSARFPATGSLPPA